MSGVKKIDHIAIVTKSLSQSLEFFERQLGLACDKIEDIPARGIRVAFLPIGDTSIELIEALHDNSEISNFLAKRGPGLHHIAFETPNLRENVVAMKQMGVEFTSKEISRGAHETEVIFVHPKSTHGVLVELLKPAGEVD